MFELLTFLGLILVIVLIHEAGHLVIAKRYGVGVPVYSIGFGPRLIGFKFYKGKVSYKILNYKPSNSKVWSKGETEYRLAPIPFGGFCSMEGEVVDEGKSNNKTLNSKPFYQKTLVAISGAVANILIGFTAILSVVVPEIGFIRGIKLTGKWIAQSTIDCFYYTYLLIIGKVPMAKWAEVSEGMSSISNFEEVLLYFGIFSIIMALFNLIPFPALDGSLPFLWSLEKIFGKKLGQKMALTLAHTGFFLLMLLQVIIVIYWVFTA